MKKITKEKRLQAMLNASPLKSASRLIADGPVRILNMVASKKR